MLNFDRYCAELIAQTNALADAVSDADVTLAVPTCPKWTLDKLIRHVGGAHRWAATIVEQRAQVYVVPERQNSPDDHAGYLREGAERLVAALRDAGPDVPVWTWTDARSAGYWARRMTSETAVHRADTLLALRRPYELPAELAADLLEEWLDLLFALRRDDEGLRGSGETLRFHTSDAGGWQVTLLPDGPRLTAAVTGGVTGGVSPDVTVDGPVTELLLVLLRRLPTDRVHVSGDAGLLERWLTSTSL